MKTGHRFSQEPIHVLVVEDSPTQAERMQYLLEENGYRVTVAGNGNRALDAARAERPNLVISDILMPEMDGYTLCQRIKSDASLKDVPVILMTSLSSPEDIVNGLECGADNFIRKPCEHEYLLARIGYILSNRKARADAKTGVEIELEVRGKRHRITSERQQILDLLMSTYEEAVLLNGELQQKQHQLTTLAAELEEKVKERTAALADEVAERKQAEAKYRGLMEAAPDAIVGIDTSRCIVFVNAQTETLFGYKREELLDQPVETLLPEPLRETYRNHCLTYFVAPAAERPVGTRLVLKGQRKDRSVFPIEITFSPLEAQNGLIVISIIRDVSEREKLERQLRQAQKMEAIGSLAGGIAHDFNNQLGVILGYSQLALQRLEDSSPLRRHISAVEKAAQSASQLTRQLLAFSRQQVMEAVVLSLNRVVTDLGSMLTRLIGENVNLVLVLDPNLATIKADPGQMEQVLMNLVVNARDAMPDGGKLTISTSNAELDESYIGDHSISTIPGRYVVLAVSDTGIGIDAETQARIFEPFFTTKEMGKGTGLGLSTVYGIVKQSGGYIWVYSEVGMGTTFKVYLPCTTEGAELTQTAKPAAVALTGNETILLVEDAEPLRELAREILEECGYTVLEASSGDQAVKLAEEYQRPIHVLVTDVIMPGMNGPVLAQRLLPRRPTLKVVYVSGYAADATGHHIAVESGGAFVEKPYSREKLTRKIREVLGTSRSGI